MEIASVTRFDRVSPELEYRERDEGNCLDLDRREEIGSVPPMTPRYAMDVVGHAGSDPGDLERRGVGRQHGFRGSIFNDLLEDRMLVIDVSGDGFEHHVGVDDAPREIGGEFDALDH